MKGLGGVSEKSQIKETKRKIRKGELGGDMAQGDIKGEKFLELKGRRVVGDLTRRNRTRFISGGIVFKRGARIRNGSKFNAGTHEKGDLVPGAG